MSVFIVDASIVAKWFVEETHTEAALSVLDEGNDLHAPDFLLLEMDSIICKWTGSRAVSPKEGSEVREALRRYPVRRHPFTSFLDSAFAVANHTGQSICDSLYVALAVLLKGRMVTADRKLCDALKAGPFGKHVVWIEDAGQTP